MSSLVRRMQIRTFKARTDVEKIPTGRKDPITEAPITVWPPFAPKKEEVRS